MRILHWVGSGTIPPSLDQYPASGVIRVALQVAAHQSQSGHVVTVAGIGGNPLRYQWNGVEILAVPAARWARIHAFGKKLDFRQHVPLVRLSKAQRWDVVHTHLYHYVRFVHAKLRVVHIHVSPGEDLRGLERLDKDADLIIAVSDFVADGLRMTVKTPVVVVPNAVDTIPVLSNTQVAERRRCLRARVGLPEDGFVFAFAGAFVPEKGLDVLCKAFAVTPGLKGAHLLVAGDETLWGTVASRTPSAYAETLKKLLQSLASQGYVHLLGKLSPEEMALLYDGSDVVVVPSVCEEGFCLVALEAMAHGRMVVASRSGALTELIAPERGILVGRGDPVELGDALVEAMENRNLRDMAFQMSTQYARQFSWGKSVETLEKAYESARVVNK